MMPDITGLELCRQLKLSPQWSHIPIIMVTALSTKDDLSRCLDTGADDFISKPVNGTELRARIRSMLRIKAQYDYVQSLLDMREDMVNMIVHDLRNPVSSILLTAELLKLPGRIPDNQRKQVERISQAGRSLESMINTLLIMAKLESNKMVLSRTNVNLFSLCTSAITDFETSAASKNLQLIIQAPEVHHPISIDANIVRRVIDNLLSNAIKFSPEDQSIIVQIAYSERGGTTIQVMDSGQGVSEPLRQLIFEKYEIGEFKAGTGQVGLGLAFCKLAIEAHGGTITVQNNHPTGAIFTIVIPSYV
jgi:signal transduction histidine kinase